MERIMIAGLAAAGALFLGLMLSRSQALQRFAVMELVLTVTVAGGAVWGFLNARQFMAEEYLKLFAVYLNQASPYMTYLETREAKGGAEEEKQLKTLLDETLPAFLSEPKKNAYLHAAVLKRTEDGYEVWTALDGGRRWAESPETIARLNELAREAESKRACVYGIPGFPEPSKSAAKGLLVLADPEKIAPEKLLLVEISMEPAWARLDGLFMGYLYAGSAILLLGTVLLIILVAVQGAELSRMCRLMRRIGEGAAEWRKPRTYSREMNLIWNSLEAIVKGIAAGNYSRYLVFRAFKRFAPGRVETMLGKASVLDVEAGACARGQGIAAAVLLSEEKADSAGQSAGMKRLNDSFLCLIRAGRDADGSFLCADRAMRRLTWLFTGDENAPRAVSFGVGAAVSLEETDGYEAGGFSILLHDTAFEYGVAGDEEQVCVFLLSDELRLLEDGMESLRRMGVRLAVTEKVRKNMKNNTAIRNIGYVGNEAGRFLLYDILDARPERERKPLLHAQKAFQEGTELYERRDYYLARSRFTDVLKECPFDGVARRYVFACEECLNMDGGQEV